MKFEIDPNELTTDQRAHVAAFITNWPHADEVDHTGEAELRKHYRLFAQETITEEQRLGDEQKRDMDTTGELGAADADNLNAIFGTPTAAERLELGAKVDSLVPLDKEGLPWDGRIHASTKTFIADGSWKLRRGVDPSEVEKVKAQLKELMAVPVVHNTGHVDYDPSSRIPAPPAPEIVPPISGPVGVVVPPAPKSHYLIDQQHATVTLTDLIARMSAAIVAGKMTQATVSEMCAKHGVSEFILLSSRPDLLPLIDADMKAMGV